VQDQGSNRSLLNLWFARPPIAGDWEAGEIPALPRNCKRPAAE
jgi:hypothetical protein